MPAFARLLPILKGNRKPKRKANKEPNVQYFFDYYWQCYPLSKAEEIEHNELRKQNVFDTRQLDYTYTCILTP